MTSANTPPAEPDMGEASESDDAAPATETDDDSVSVALTAIGEGAKPGDMITMKVVSVSPDDGTAMLMPSMKKGTMAVKGKAYDLSGAMK